MRHLGLALLLLAGIALPTFAAPATVQAECPFVAIPPATEAARSARELLVGTVEITRDGRKYDVVLHVEHVLRGPAQVGDVRSFKNLYPNWPRIKVGRNRTMGPCQPIPAYEGSVMVLALDAVAPDGRTTYNGASWIRSGPEYNHRIVDTTLAEMRALVALPMTDAALPASAERPDERSRELVLVVAFGLGLLALAARTGRRTGMVPGPSQGRDPAGDRPSRP